VKKGGKRRRLWRLQKNLLPFDQEKRRQYALKKEGEKS